MRVKEQSSGALGTVVTYRVPGRVRVNFDDGSTITYQNIAVFNKHCEAVVDEKLEDSRDELALDVEESLKALETKILQMNKRWAEGFGRGIALKERIQALEAKVEAARSCCDESIDEMSLRIDGLDTCSLEADNQIKKTLLRVHKLEQAPKVALPELVRCRVTGAGPWIKTGEDPCGRALVFKGEYAHNKNARIDTHPKEALEPYKPRTFGPVLWSLACMVAGAAVALLSL